jgi:carotenoid cleavage dioxygenase
LFYGEDKYQMYGILSAYVYIWSCRMLHGLKIKDGKATYVARFVRTSRLEQEENYGAAKFLKAST